MILDRVTGRDGDRAFESLRLALFDLVGSHDLLFLERDRGSWWWTEESDQDSGRSISETPDCSIPIITPIMIRLDTGVASRPGEDQRPEHELM